MLYLISDGTRVKIGKSKNPEKRLKQLQTGSALKLKLLGTFDLSDHYEKRLHWILRNFRTQGEWFELGAEGTNWIQEYIKELESSASSDKMLGSNLLNQC